MRVLREWLIRLWGTFRRRRSDADLEQELRVHLDLAAEAARHEGRPAADPERAARLRAGGVSQALDALRDQRGLPWLNATAAGLAGLPKFVLRHRGYFAFATTTLAVAVGVNLVVFTIVNALWLRPLPFRDADRLVTFLYGGFTSLDAPVLTTRMPRPFAAVAGQVETDDGSHPFDYAGYRRPRVVLNGRDAETVGVTSGFFTLLGLSIRGRDFTSDDNRAGAEPVAIISNRLWSDAFGRRPEVIGAVVPTEPMAVRVVGVAPRGFEGARRGDRTDIWIPSTLAARVAGVPADDVPLIVFARLAPGEAFAEAARQVGPVAPGDPRALTIAPLTDVFGTPSSPTIVIHEGHTLGVVGGLALLVLAGGCATLAALVLVHYERRRRELAVRIALGASRGRLAGELCRELLLIAACGTCGAMLLAEWGLHAIPSLSLPGGVNLARLDLSMDWRVLSVAVAVTVFTLVAAAWVPLKRFTRAALAGELLAGPAATPSAASQRTRQGLLALHVSATIVVLIAAGLFVRAVVHGFGNAAGFDYEHTAFVTVPIGQPGDYASIKSPSDWSFFDSHAHFMAIAERDTRVKDALALLPGVDHVADGAPPIGPDRARLLLSPRVVDTEGRRLALPVAAMNGGPDLLPTLGLPLLEGRALTAADATTTPTPAIVTVSLARMLWPGEDPLGKVFRFPGGRSTAYQLVGLTRDFVVGSLARPAAGVVVTVIGEVRSNYAQLVVRTTHPEALVDDLQRAAQHALPDTPWATVETGREMIARDLGRQRLGAWFFSGFGLTALLLGVGGVFGLVAYLAESRYREFGVRLALGATPRDLVRHGLAAALAPVSLGAAAGLVFAALVARLFTSLLTGLSAVDPLTYAGVAATMLSAAVLAGLAAAWRLRRVVPVDALRTE